MMLLSTIVTSPPTRSDAVDSTTQTPTLPPPPSLLSVTELDTTARLASDTIVADVGELVARGAHAPSDPCGGTQYT